MQTGEVAAQAGVNAQTLRYYERRGCCRSAIRRRAPVHAELPLTTAVITDPDVRLLGVVRTADPPAGL